MSQQVHVTDDGGVDSQGKNTVNRLEITAAREAKVTGTITSLPAITGTVAVSNMIPAVETGLATSAKQLPDGHGVLVLNALIPVKFDELVCSYTGSNLTGIVYKLTSSTVATLTLGYDGSNNLTSVVRT